MKVLQHRRTKSGGLISFRSDSGYIFDDEGNIVAWYNPTSKWKTPADYEEQINELRAEIDMLKQKQQQNELKGAQSAAPLQCNLQVDSKQIYHAADQIKKEIDKAFRNL